MSRDQVERLAVLGAPPAMPSISAVTARDRALTVMWTAPAAFGSSLITSYDLRRIRTDATEAQKAIDAYWMEHASVWSNSASVLMATIDGLDNGVSYDVQVRGTNLIGDGDWSDTSSETPSIQNQAPTFADRTTTRSVDEGTPSGRPIGMPVTATDPETDPLTYSLQSGDDLVAIDDTTGQLRTKAALDHEGAPSHTVMVGVSDMLDSNDEADTEIDDNIVVIISVTDVNEPPEIKLGSVGSGVTANGSHLTVEENHAGAVATFSASDPEDDQSLTYEWSLGSTDGSDFTISELGVLTFAASPDYERPADSGGNNVYDIRVRALDSDNKLSFVLITVTVRPVNEPPAITGNASPSIEEEGNLLIETYQAKDPDNATIAWQPLGGDDSDQFEFTSSNGRLEFKTAPNYEAATDRGSNNIYDVTLSASPGGDTKRFEIAVTVTNKEEFGSLGFFSPQPQADADYTATLSDPDEVLSTTWTWERSTSRNGRWTTVSGATDGRTTSVNRPDADDVGYYLRVTASYTDGHGPNKSLVQRSANSVIAAPVNNTPPTFDTPSTTREIAEDARPNASVGAAVTATDPGDVLTYTLTGSSLFTIDNASGRIRVVSGAALDHETGPSHIVTVTASDSSNASASISVTINVTNVNEPPQAPDGSATTHEDMPVTFDVLADASDPEHDVLTVSLGNGPRKGSATVDPNTYEITYSPKADYHGSDTVTYILTDAGGLTDTGEVALEVIPVNDPPQFTGGPRQRDVARSAQAGDDVGRPVTATDVDGDMLTYRLSGPGAASFAINVNTGQITVGTGAVFDPALQAEYAVTVEARDRDFPRAEVRVTINVVERVQPRTTGGGGGGGGGPPPIPIPSDEDFDWNVTRDINALNQDNDLPTGIWSDGDTLWVLENAASGADSQFAYDLESGERQEDSEFELDRRNRFSHGIWSDGETVWVADSGQDQLFAYELETGERVEERELELHEDNRDPRGIWSDGEVMYVLDSVKDALFVYSLGSGDLLSEHALDKLNRSPRGIWSDGFTLWVSDDGATRLFAYEFEDGALKRNEDLEFTFRSLLKAGNGNPRGIWSDGDVMYVVDEQDDKVYTYNIADAIIALLSSLTLSELEIEEFSPVRLDYTAIAAPEVSATTVVTEATQAEATVMIEPVDADGDAENGHQVTLEAETAIAITVTSGDGSRTTTYRVPVSKPPCLGRLTDERLSEVRFAGGSLDDLDRCAREQRVAAFFYWTGESWLLYAPAAPEFLSRQFNQNFSNGVPAGILLIAASTGGRGTDK